MSISTVKSSLDNIAQEIRTERQAVVTSVARINTSLGNINAIPTKYASDISEIQAYVGTDPFEALSKDELAKMTTEFTALKSAVTSAVNALSTLEF